MQRKLLSEKTSQNIPDLDNKHIPENDPRLKEIAAIKKYQEHQFKNKCELIKDNFKYSSHYIDELCAELESISRSLYKTNISLSPIVKGQQLQRDKLYVAFGEKGLNYNILNTSGMAVSKVITYDELTDVLGYPKLKKLKKGNIKALQPYLSDILEVIAQKGDTVRCNHNKTIALISNVIEKAKTYKETYLPHAVANLAAKSTTPLPSLKPLKKAITQLSEHTKWDPIKARIQGFWVNQLYVVLRKLKDYFWHNKEATQTRDIMKQKMQYEKSACYNGSRLFAIGKKLDQVIDQSVASRKLTK